MRRNAQLLRLEIVSCAEFASVEASPPRSLGAGVRARLLHWLGWPAKEI